MNEVFTTRLSGATNMPFKSKAQKKYLFSQHPEIAEEFSEHTSKKAYKKLPEHVDQKKGKNEHMKMLSKKHMRAKSVK